MSVAYELFPCEYPEDPAEGQLVRQLAAHHRPALATVSVLHPPQEAELARSLTLTRRGQVAVALAVAVLGAVFVWLASGSAPAVSASPAVPASVTVQSGDTLWSIASRVAPQADPRVVVQALQQRNHLVDAQLMPGEVLRLR